MAITDDIVYRAYQPGDEKAILSLFEVSYGKPLDPDLWQWQYRRSMVDRMDVCLAFLDGRLIGHAAGWPVEMVNGRERFGASRTQNIMVHPEYRRHKIMTAALEKLADRNRSQGVDFWFAFLNRPAAVATLTGPCGFSLIHHLRNYVCRCSRWTGSASADVRMAPAAFSGEDADVFSAHGPADKLHFARSENYLSWRYVAHPRNRYVVARRILAGRVRGLCVFKVFETERLMDVLELAGDPSDARILLESIADSHRTQTDTINVWSADHYPLHPALMEMGFEAGPLTTAVVYRPLSGRCTESFMKFENWYLMLGDSDLY